MTPASALTRPATTTAAEFMGSRTAPLRLVIFDCDGVIVDSEALSNGVLARDMTARGWPLSSEEAQRLFLGRSLEVIRAIMDSHLAAPLPPDWDRVIVERIVAEMAAGAVAIPGAVEALHGVTALRVPWRIASNSSHAEMRAKFGRLGIAALVEGRAHSREDVALPKPAPDLFLHVAALEGVTPEQCVVVEDSVAGASAALAAGMDCLGFDRFEDGTALRAVGAVPFRTMSELPGLIDLALERTR